MDTWKAQTNEDCRALAERFRTAKSAAVAASSFDRTGLRWSGLLRLPYYNPTRFLVVDPMHNLFLGLIKEHFQGILGYRKVTPKTPLPAFSETTIRINIMDDPTNPVPNEKKTRSSVRKLVAFLEQPMDFDSSDQTSFDAAVNKLGKSTVHVAAFVHVGRGIGCLPSTLEANGVDTNVSKRLSKKELARRVLSWVCFFPYI